MSINKRNCKKTESTKVLKVLIHIHYKKRTKQDKHISTYRISQNLNNGTSFACFQLYYPALSGNILKSKKINEMKKIAIIGAGNLGSAIANGLLKSDFKNKMELILTRRNVNKLKKFSSENIEITSDNKYAVEKSDIIIISVKPQKFKDVLNEFKNVLNDKHIIISTVTGLNINKIKKETGNNISIFRVMPNTAIAIQESITCISSSKKDDKNIEIVKEIFDRLGKSIIIDDEMMGAATVLAASGIAFALRYIRASMQAGIEIGFGSELAQIIAAQTVKGASFLILQNQTHPEQEIDKVTTPLGITITGLNLMEYNGFSSSIIQGVLGSYKKIEKLR